MLEATNLQSAHFEATACKMLQGGFKAKDSAPGQFLHPTAAKAHPWINILDSSGFVQRSPNVHGEHDNYRILG